MKKKILILVLIVGVPLMLGFVLGYRIAHTRVPSSPDAAFANGESTDVTTTGYFQESTRDSISSEISNQRRNAITRAVAMASPRSEERRVGKECRL